jgi:hypothetical protein
MELQTEVHAAIVAPIGTKVNDRKMNAVAIATSSAALAAAAARGGKVGKEAAAKNLGVALVDMAQHCANSNYRPLAEYLAIATGKVTVVDRHVFHALPALYKAEMETLESMGKAISATTGKASAAYTLANDLHRLCSGLVEASERIRAERDAERKARELTEAIKAEMARLEAVDTAVDTTVEA